MQIIQKKIDELIPYENNTKKHDDAQIRNVAESIKQYGFVQPLVIDKDNVIVIGHCRYEASKTLGMEEVPCVLVDNLTEEQVKALRIVDNKTNESEWDMDILPEELDELDLNDFEFSFDDFMQEEVEQIEKQEIKPKIPFTEILYEENNYIILQFKTDIDWLQAQTLFGIESVQCHSTRSDGKINEKMKRIGVGRVLDGKKAIDKLMENTNEY